MKLTKKYLDSKNIDYVVTAGGMITIQGNFMADPEITCFGKLERITGSVYVQQGATLTAPALHTVDEFRMNGEFLGHQVAIIDEIGCVVLSEKERNGVLIRQCRKSSFKNGKLIGDKFYVASRGSNNAHGETIKIAIDELAFKEGSRNIDQFRNMPLETKKSPVEWAMVYRMVTGACQYGTKSFMESKGKLKKTYTLKEILEQTRGAYANEQFRRVVVGEVAA
jgi:hypothetical protein